MSQHKVAAWSHAEEFVTPSDHIEAAHRRAEELDVDVIGNSELPEQREWLTRCARALGEAELAFNLAKEYVKQRKVFGQAVFDFQNTQFKLAEMKTDIEVGRSFLHDGVRKHRAGNYGIPDGAMIKLWIPEMSARVIDNALQMFGGSGYMDEMTISKIYRANRVYRIYAGTSEIQKSVIARRL